MLLHSHAPFGRAVFALVIAATLCRPAFAQAPEAACPTQFADAVKLAKPLAPAAAAPFTAFLPEDDDAGILLSLSANPKALSATDPHATYSVFQGNTIDLSDPATTGRQLPVIAVQAPTGKLPDGLDSAKSVLVRFRVDAGRAPLWRHRQFLVVSCYDNHFAGWGMVTARVSDRVATGLICLVVALLLYLLSMTSVWLTRRSVHPLAAKYPAVFSARRIQAMDFFNPIHLTANAFNQASVQKLQVLLFSALVGWLLLSLVLRTGLLVDLSPTVIGLLGISGIGAAAAQITYQQKTRLSFENWAWLQRRGVLKLSDPTTSGGPRWRELVLTNREFDVYKLQTIIFSVAVAFALIGAGAASLSDFSVPPTLLGILGLSQVVYIGGVLVRPPAVADLDETLTKLRAAGEAVAAAKTLKTDTGADGKLLDKLPPGQEVAVNAQRQYDDLADRVIPMIESTLEVEADRGKL